MNENDLSFRRFLNSFNTIDYCDEPRGWVHRGYSFTEIEK
jgi:hypothetical protein